MSSSEFSATSSLPLPSPPYSNALMSIRSMTPRTSCSEPIGISVATTCEPKASLSESRVRKKSARSRSSMFTNTRRARPPSSARLHSRSVWTSTPITALTTTTAASTTRRAASVSATKLGSPGVSIRLILRSPYSKEATLAPMDMERSCSSGSKSETVVPSSTRPSRLITPASNSSASQRLVFPLPRWPIRATLRIRSAGLRAIPTQYMSPHTSDLVRSPGKARAKRQHGLGVKLRHPRLGNSQNLADLAQGQVLVVVQGDHESFALRQRLDRVGETILELGRLGLGLRVDGAGVLKGVEDRDLAAAALGVGERPQVIERQHGGVGDRKQGFPELIDAHLQF